MGLTSKKGCGSNAILLISVPLILAALSQVVAGRQKVSETASMIFPDLMNIGGSRCNKTQFLCAC